MKFIQLNVYVGKEEKFQINNLNFHLNALGKKKSKKKRAKASLRKKIIKRPEITEL